MHLSNYSLHADCYESIERSTIIVVCAITIIVYIVLSAMREIIQIYQQRLCYVLEIVNLISWILYISTLIMIMPVFKNDASITNVHYSAASISVFLSWFRLLLLLQRFDQVQKEKKDNCRKRYLHYILVTLTGWHLCGNVSGDSANSHQSTAGLLDTDNSIRFSVLHSTIEGSMMLMKEMSEESTQSIFL